MFAPLRLRRPCAVRAVRSDELASIRQLGCFTNIPGLECKYFALSVGGAQAFARLAQQSFADGPYTVAVTAIDGSLLPEDCRTIVDQGVEAMAIPTALLYALQPPTILEGE